MEHFTVNSVHSVEAIFEYLNAESVLYVWLHGYDRCRWGDIDIAVYDVELADVRRLVEGFCDTYGFLLLQEISHESSAVYYVLVSKDTFNDYLAVDICTDYRRNGRILISGARLVAGRIWHGSYYIPAPETEAAYLFLKRSLKSYWTRDHLNDFEQKCENDNVKIYNMLRDYLPVNILHRFVNFAATGNLDGVNKLCSTIRRQILIRTLAAHPIKTVIYHSKELMRIKNRIARTTGLFIAIIGTDGCGKTTIIGALSEALSPAFRKQAKYHWKPTILGKGLAENSFVPEPHRLPPRSASLSFCKIIIYSIQYLLGYLLIMYPKKIRSTLIIFDRYYYDLLVDQRRFRIKLPKRVLEIFLKVIPKPDIVFCLRTKPVIAFKRKNELGIIELQRQVSEFERLRGRIGKRFFVIDNNGSPDESLESIKRIIFTMLANRIRIG
jgi:thymidylate kinase